MKFRQHVLLPLFASSLMLLPFAASTAAAASTASAQKAAPKKKAKKAAVRKPVRKSAAAPKIDYQGKQVDLAQWESVSLFADDMVRRHGYGREEIDALIAKVRFIESAVQLVKPMPAGKPKNWQVYQSRFVEPIRINAGVRFWNANADLLARAESEYGVPAEIIVGIIGVETIYGRDTGRFRVMDVLATLAFAYPETPNREARMAFFRSELENTLLLARKFNTDPFSLQGSFAGAIGMPQFMPGNILKLGVDFDRDGAVDVRDSAADAIGSVANFLVEHGWRRDQPGELAYPARVRAEGGWEKFINAGLSASNTQEELAQAGITTQAPLPAGEKFGLVDLQNGFEPTEYWLGSNNFFAITQYNRSFFYAMSVINLGRAVKLARGA
ncbi:lytic murein transglycosylase B [Pseudoduganella sp. GCM10020061]|uniref:lytic murein transglycosylase B n=1 Tax=Pseudoduganella sp. GCM10020061 TaxID=3317345 RepID=UPI00363F99C8